MADNEPVDPDLGLLKAVGAYMKDQLSRAQRVKKSLRQRS
jgi:hypothetical protein